MERPIILFGAFDRHNFGDLLFPHIAAALLPHEHLVFAGLTSRDLRPYGGHEVRALAQLAADWGERAAILIHVGGEILTCSAWQAAVMLLPPEQAQDTLAYLNARPQEKMQWVRSRVRSSALAPYTLSRQRFPGLARVIYNAAGGVDLDQADPALRVEVLANLGAADDVSVRDRQTLAHVTAAGIKARLMPDPAVMVAELFGTQIRQHGQQGEVAHMRRELPQGYIAVQFSADFSDDEALMEIAAQLDQIMVSSGLGVVLFRAGAAPWHDDLACYQHVAARMLSASVKVFESLDVWDICALIANCRAYCGSSLHGRIVAMAFALPRINLRQPASIHHASKQTAFAATWEEAGVPGAVDVGDIAGGIQRALAVDPDQLRRTAAGLVTQYRQGFEAMYATVM
ncbi:polysaccharide pyruvyl transferase family protein [Rhodoferax sp.]|uniref:polysaccharide pyruvyl transferase family protein n=1 Tax=Rhodoferax sp. TaxID=50421 RepID=UPI002722B5A5|nr:polysaccharide pyruvyl transferase family protein [Rhodoferax sp.]MDO9196804.1 polysaccharide pyruvyl transferase family protein [Rhodoferax sp.]